jgi:hypothetical protein
MCVGEAGDHRFGNRYNQWFQCVTVFPRPIIGFHAVDGGAMASQHLISDNVIL